MVKTSQPILPLDDSAQIEHEESFMVRGDAEMIAIGHVAHLHGIGRKVVTHDAPSVATS